MKRNITIADFSAVVTGVLLALNMPPAIPLWIVAVGGFLAIVLIKQLFGGIGQNFMNPALGARVILLLAWTQQMTDWTNPAAPDAITGATPLEALKKGAQFVEAIRPGYLELFLGYPTGSIGEASILALLIGGLYLIFRKVISPAIPVSFIGTAALLAFIFGGDKLFTGDFCITYWQADSCLARFYGD